MPPVAMTTRSQSKRTGPQCVLARTPVTALSSTISRRAAIRSMTVIEGVSRASSVQNAHDFTAAAIAARMNNAATRMRRFEAKQKFAFPVAIEGRAEADQVLDRSRRRGENPLGDSFVAKPSPASSVSAEMQ